MKVLIACERSGTVRNAFIKKGHDAISCDIQASLDSGPHYQGDVKDILDDDWDLLIAHPPCTYLTTTGNKWFYHPDDKDLPVEQRRPHPRFPNRRVDREEGADFFMLFANCDHIDKICIENPVGIMSTRWRKPDQIIQPYHFGHNAAKKTCLWLKNLPVLEHTDVVEPDYVTFKSGKRMSKWYLDATSLSKEERSNVRSQTFQGIADAMANQWG